MSSLGPSCVCVCVLVGAVRWVPIRGRDKPGSLSLKKKKKTRRIKIANRGTMKYQPDF